MEVSGPAIPASILLIHNVSIALRLAAIAVIPDMALLRTLRNPRFLTACRNFVPPRPAAGEECPSTK
jgi:hypothetical protein